MELTFKILNSKMHIYLNLKIRYMVIEYINLIILMLLDKNDII